jgi:hypothetical protein
VAEWPGEIESHVKWKRQEGERSKAWFQRRRDKVQAVGDADERTEQSFPLPQSVSIED